ncbi:MAG TPA: HAMP domain-containing histidine kinase [Candidatus Agathobaculum merdavium]|nr:HAMP domain-containing histidine kinase [Candidatus Agathobaculum merdavium]
MKSKHRNFWSFFWRVGAGFLAFYLAVMGVFTYVTAQRKLEEARETRGDYNELLDTANHETEQGEIVYGRMQYYICNKEKQPLTMVGIFDKERNLLASSGNYYSLGTGLYIDLERWLTEEEVFQLIRLEQESREAYPVKTGNTFHKLYYQGWQDNGMFIPYRLTYATFEYYMLEDGGIMETKRNDETVLMERQPDIDTSGLFWNDQPFECLMGHIPDNFTLPGFDVEDGVSGYIKARDSAELEQMRARMMTLAEGMEDMNFVIGAWNEDNTIFHYYVEVGRYLGQDMVTMEPTDYSMIYVWSYYPLRDAMDELRPVYGMGLLAMIAMSAVLAFALLRVWRKQERVEQTRRDTTAALAHELKTPLAVLSATAELLSGDMAQDKRAHYLDVIQQQAQRMDGSVRRMLELSRLEAGAKALRRERVSLSTLARERLDAAVPPDSRLHTSVIVDDADEAEADRALLARALDAIFENAVQHTLPDGSITVRIEHGVCAVVNTGEAIPSAALPRLWEPYFQADPARTAKGDGLGLSIAKTVFDLHGYAYGAENTPAGPRFWFRFG